MVKKAKESSIVSRSRQKLEKQLKDEHRRVTREAIRKMRQAMEIYFERHKPERINLKGKLELFDENRHSVPPQNRFVRELAKRLKQEMVKSRKNLKGVTHINK